MTAPTAADPIPFWEDLLEIFYSPRAVFERRKAAGFGLPMVVILVLFIGMFFAGRSLMQPIFDAEFDRGFALAMKQNPQITPDKAEQSKAVAKAFSGVFIGGYALIAPMLAGLLLWLFGKFVEARQELGAACMVAVYAFYPRLLESMLNLLQAALLPAEQLTSRYSLQLGPARFLDPDNSSLVLLTILGRLDLVTLWCTALLAIGLSVTGKIPLPRAAIAAGLVWLAAGLWPLWGAIRAG